MKIDCISDLHGHFPSLPGGDLLILAGDYTARHTHDEYAKFYRWLWAQEYQNKVFISGNHDSGLRSCPLCIDLPANCHYLEDGFVEIEGLKIWGSPWSLTFPSITPDCLAYTVDRDEALAVKWGLIPCDVDILVTHMPPFGIMDKISAGSHVGSRSLKSALEVVVPSLHVFGHIHEGYGRIDSQDGSPIFVNSSHMDECYRAINKEIRVDW